MNNSKSIVLGFAALALQNVDVVDRQGVLSTEINNYLSSLCFTKQYDPIGVSPIYARSATIADIADYPGVESGDLLAVIDPVLFPGGGQNPRIYHAGWVITENYPNFSQGDEHTVDLITVDPGSGSVNRAFNGSFVVTPQSGTNSTCRYVLLQAYKPYAGSSGDGSFLINADQPLESRYLKGVEASIYRTAVVFKGGLGAQAFVTATPLFLHAASLDNYVALFKQVEGA
jgi:hypothetical protein